MADNKRFMGHGFSFPFRVDPATNRIAMSSAEQDVEEAIRIILRTNLGERVMLPEFGTSAGDFLFRTTVPSASPPLRKASAKRWSSGSRG